MSSVSATNDDSTHAPIVGLCYKSPSRAVVTCHIFI